MNIINIKGSLHDKGVLGVLLHSQYMPTEEKLNLLADKYEADVNVSAFACIDGIIVVGVIVVMSQALASLEILSIAVEPDFRAKGIGSKLLSFVTKHLSCSHIYAETDADAVGFYRKCGFNNKSLGEKYPGVIRYHCSLINILIFAITPLSFYSWSSFLISSFTADEEGGSRDNVPCVTP